MAKQAETGPDKDVETLFSDEEVSVAGERITVREFRYLEGLKAAALARPILAGLRELAESDAEMSPEAIDALIGEHHEVWLKLIAMSTGREEAWLSQLPDDAGTALGLAFWRVNQNFFSRRLVLAAGLKRALDGAYRLRRSSPSSCAPATGATTATSASA